MRRGVCAAAVAACAAVTVTAVAGARQSGQPAVAVGVEYQVIATTKTSTMGTS